MGNIFNNNLHNLKLAINYDEYWDFILNKDNLSCYSFDTNSLYDKCLISYIDLDNEACIDNDWIYSLSDYQWEYAFSNGKNFYNIGYTGVDNGLIQFRKDRISNKEFIKIFSESDFSLEKDDNRLKLHAISGNTLKYEYPYEVLDDCIKLTGGFYQGVIKTDCSEYQILPTNLENGEVWCFEFILKPSELETSEKILNFNHKNNSGIFFYLGTRAENKWVFLYDKNFYQDLDHNTINNLVDLDEMDCEPKKFQNLDWYDDLEMWRIKEQESTTGMNLDNFIDYIYYPTSLYIEQEEEFMDSYINLNSKPLIINDKDLSKDLEECCNEDLCGKSKTITHKIITKTLCCGCGKCKTISSITEEEIIQNNNCGWCHAMDDFLLDINDVFYESDEDYFYVEDELDLDDFEFQTAKYGLSLNNSTRYNTIYSDNKFLLFHRCSTGYTVKNWVEDTVVEYRQVKNNFKGNLFLLMNRTCTGYTVSTIQDLIDEYNEKYNLYDDLYDNAIAFRITDLGEIGYRILTKDCTISGDNKIKIIEGYSKPNVIKKEQWQYIHIRIEGTIHGMLLKFYVDGKLKYITKEIPKINLRKLMEEDEKQEMVSFNLSLGGGSQGLCDVIFTNYMDIIEKILPIEENFAGTFIGYIKKFRWYNCVLNYNDINHNYQYEKLNFLKNK